MPHESTEGTGRSRQPARKPGRRWPPWWVWGLVTALVTGIAYIRIQNPYGDHAIVNLLTLVLGFLACVVLVSWFVLLGGYSRVSRYGGLLCGFIAIGVAAVTLEIEGVNGELVPEFRLRFAPSADELLAIPQQHSTSVQFTQTALDYPQFLGPDRTARTDAVRLDPAWDKSTPRLLWRQPIGAGWSAFAAANGYAVTLEQRGAEELVTCYRIETGELMWSSGTNARHSTKLGGTGPRSTPTIDEGRVYALGAQGRLVCLDGTSGETVWEVNILEQNGVSLEAEGRQVAWGRANSPLVVDDLLIVPTGGQPGDRRSLTAYDKLSGEIVWQGGNRQVSYASPAIATLAGVRQILSVNENNVSGHDPADGTVLWEYDWPGSSNANASSSQPVVVDGEHLLLSKAYGTGGMLLKLNAAPSLQAEQVWGSARVLKTKFTNVVLHQGFVYALSDGILECVDVMTGKRRWQARRGGRYGHGQIMGVGDLLLVQTESGDVALVEASPEQFRELARTPAVEGRTWNNLCLYGRYLLSRNADQACCLELPLAEEDFQ